MSSTLAGLALAFLAGLPLGVATVGRSRAGMLAGVSMLAGLGILPTALFVLSLLRLPWSLAAMLAAAGCLLAGTVAILRRGAEPSDSYRSANDSPGGRIVSHVADAALLIIAAGYARFATLAGPSENDFLAIWGLKGKVFWFHRGIDWPFLLTPNNVFTHTDYPLLLPLQYDVLAIVANVWKDRWYGVVHVAFGIGALLVVRGSIAHLTGSRLVSSIAAVGLSASALSPWIGLGEGPLISFATAGLLLVREGVNDSPRGQRMLFTGSLLLGFAGFTKNEGIALSVAAVAALLWSSGSLRRTIRMWPALAIPLPWMIIRLIFQLPTDLAQGNVLHRLVARVLHPAEFLSLIAANPVGHPLFWSGVVVALAMSARHLLERERFLTTTMFLQLVFVVGAYLVTPRNLVWHFQWAWERVISQQALPLGVLAVLGVAPAVVAILRRESVPLHEQ